MTKVYDHYEALSQLSTEMGIRHHGTPAHQKLEEALAEMRKEFKKDHPEPVEEGYHRREDGYLYHNSDRRD